MIKHIHMLLALLTVLLLVIRGMAQMKSLTLIQNYAGALKKTNMLLSILLLATGLLNAYANSYFNSGWVYIKLTLFAMLLYGNIAIFSKKISDTNFRLALLFLLGMWFFTFYVAFTKPLFN